MKHAQPATARAMAAFTRVFESPRRALIVVFIAVFVLLLAWSLATPLFASPDEPTQITRAAAIVRGQPVGRTIKDAGNPLTTVTVPAVFATGGLQASCYVFHDTVPASCSPHEATTKRDVSTTTYVGRYPPLYYVMVGWPSLIFVSPSGIYLMRVMSDILSALLIALACWAIVKWSTRKFLVVGTLVAATPMALFLGSTVNPSGMEIMSALCFWVCGTILVTEQSREAPKGLVVLTALVGACLAASRGISLLWVAMIIIMLLLIGGYQALRDILRNRAAQVMIGIVSLVVIFSLWWVISQHALDLLPVGVRVSHHDSTLHILAMIFGNTSTWMQQMIGIFGWLTTFAPALSYFLWFGVVGFLLVLAFAAARWRHNLALTVLLLAVLFIPVVISYSQVFRLGVIWQARYIMPLAVGIPIVAAVMIQMHKAIEPLYRRMTFVVLAAVGVAQIAAFVQALRRYAVGANGTLDFFRSSWHPPGGLLGLSLIAVVGVAGIVGCGVGIVAAGQAPSRPVTAPEGAAGRLEPDPA